ncbi:hypothetical protein MKY82_05625 [Paenibacillus sp. FSL W7-1279]|uniref:hypothetical protein n=1 Tax=Paenibacillus sp. FSL W7-1279 TaxID=2921697 RepID=UPI0030D88436
MANSVKDTATSLVEDPLDTAKDMAYNMTIGTIEEAAETVVWGGKMIFDADTQVNSPQTSRRRAVRSILPDSKQPWPSQA